ncbi:MAG: DUF4082 domain-containing protein [Methylotetracoccus sp.]|nr:DUF4082 domain-containing protein [Methylotetracoccus sp.]
MKNRLFSGRSVSLYFLLFGSALFFLSDSALAESMNLAWDASPSTNAAGYRISFGTTSGGPYTPAKDVDGRTTTSTTVSSASLNACTTYYFVAQAYDASKTSFSVNSNQVSGQPADTTGPTASTLTGTAASSSQVNLSWGASTDSCGVTGYAVQRCTGSGCSNFTQVTTTTGRSYSNTNLTPGTYSYRVGASDPTGNVTYSNVVTIATSAASDTSPPTVPAGLTATAVSSSQINLSWTASNDNIGVAGYRVYRAGTQIATVATASYSDNGVSASTAYTYTVAAYDAAGNTSAQSSSASATTPATPPPTATSCTSNCTIWPNNAVPGTASNSDASAVEVGLKFTSDVAGQITGIRFFKGSANTGTHVGNLWTANGTNLASATFTNETASGWQQVNFAAPVTIAANTTYIASYFAPVGRYAINSSGLNASVDNAPLHALSAGSSGGNGVYAYGTSSRFPVQTWNGSNYWVDVVFSAASVADTAAPSTPANVSGTAASSVQINLSWSASTDNVGVTEYRIERCQGSSCTNFAQIGTATGTTYANTGLTASTTYRYRVRATDAAGNLSGYSNVVTVATPAAADTAAPSVPASLTATAASSSEINLSWSASTDNVGVTGYQVERCQGSTCSVGTASGTSYSDTGLSASTTYSYRVRARDAAGNLSGYSNTASATTQATPPPSSTSTSCTSNCTIWPGTAVPNTVDDGDRSSIEVGVKFTSDIPGQITGIRFYKGTANTGTHVGSLWTANGAKLASATFTNETSSGWQQVNFGTPVTIAANTTYVASYSALNGGYSADVSSFYQKGVDSPPLRALADQGTAAPNGVYNYPAGTFPTTGWRQANYWVDVVFSSTTCTPAPAANGLVAAYGFEEASGSTVLDRSGNCNNGTISGATRVSNGKYGKAVSFGGANSWITIPHSASLDLAGGMTIEAWVKSASASLGDQRVGVLSKEASGGAVYELIANSGTTSAAGGPLAGILTAGSAWKETVADIPLMADTWRHLAATYDSSTGYLRMYVDGTQVDRSQTSGTISLSGGVLRIGGRVGQLFSGLIDEVRIYNRRLCGDTTSFCTSTPTVVSDMNTAVGP